MWVHAEMTLTSGTFAVRGLLKSQDPDLMNMENDPWNSSRKMISVPAFEIPKCSMNK